nr:putative integron gene cassette protein [uncultured bacterium]CAP48736.1 putative integron gene cassette protein [uncultured bacterium]CAP49141.1 putative integron gene cassette protein [uncultured bacterium]
MTNRKEVSYNNFTIIAAHFRGKFQGRATYDLYWREELPRIEYRAEDVSSDAVVENLKRQVDEFNANKSEAIGKIRLANHRLFLSSAGIAYQGVRTTLRGHRVTHCYKCRKGLDNSIDTECNACGWIICNCGACGCGWSA